MTKLLAAVAIAFMVVMTELILVYKVPTYPPVVDDPRAEGNVDVIVPVGEPELRGVL